MTNNMKHDTRLLPISQIKIGDRHRKDLGDLLRPRCQYRERASTANRGLARDGANLGIAPPRGNPRCPWER